jgi:hypothetical protein
MGDDAHEDVTDGPGAARAAAPRPGAGRSDPSEQRAETVGTTGPAGAVLRLELREADGAGSGPARSQGAVSVAAARNRPAQAYTVRADRLTVEEGRLSLWRGAELVFQCPAAELAAIGFESPAEPPAAANAGAAHPYQGPYQEHQKAHDPLRDAHHDLSSANTRWTAEDEHRLRELHQAGIPLDAIARALGRQRGAVRARLARLRSDTNTDPGSNTGQGPDSVDR